MLHDCEDQSQSREVNDINFVPVVSDPCESDAVQLNEEDCDVRTGENTLQSNANLYSQTADKHFKCNISCKSFASKQSVTSHLYQHTIQNPFTCNICNKSFSRKPNLTIHLRIHNNEKPFKCNICSKSFSQKSHLTEHLRIHNKV